MSQTFFAFLVNYLVVSGGGGCGGGGCGGGGDGSAQFGTVSNGTTTTAAQRHPGLTGGTAPLPSDCQSL